MKRLILLTITVLILAVGTYISRADFPPQTAGVSAAGFDEHYTNGFPVTRNEVESVIKHTLQTEALVRVTDINLLAAGRSRDRYIYATVVTFYEVGSDRFRRGTVLMVFAVKNRLTTEIEAAKPIFAGYAL